MVYLPKGTEKHQEFSKLIREDVLDRLDGITGAELIKLVKELREEQGGDVRFYLDTEYGSQTLQVYAFRMENDEERDARVEGLRQAQLAKQREVAKAKRDRRKARQAEQKSAENERRKLWEELNKEFGREAA